jgi:isoleucyl-tRNA synthetase
MRVAQTIVALGRAARERAGIKVRQPLATLYVRVPGRRAEADVNLVRDIILEELNVRSLVFAGDDDEFLDYSIRPNLPALGPRFGKRIPAVRAALQGLPPAQVAAAVQRGEDIMLDLDGDRVSLGPTDVLVDVHEREGFAAMAESGYLAALDTRLTEELIAEGLVRDVVRRLNEWRKDAGLDLQDRIQVRYEASERLAGAIKQFRDFICAETLAVSLDAGDSDGSAFNGEAEFGGETLRVGLQRA